LANNAIIGGRKGINAVLNGLRADKGRRGHMHAEEDFPHGHEEIGREKKNLKKGA